MAHVDPDEFPELDDLADQPTEVRDERDDLPLFLHSELDDLPLTSRAFRVYAHLVRRVGRNGRAWPSYQSIGEQCFRCDFKSRNPATLRRRAMEAIKELRAAGLITIDRRSRANGAQTSNIYRLTPRREWRHGK